MGGASCRPEPRAHASFFCCVSRKLCCGPSRRGARALFRSLEKGVDAEDIESLTEIKVSWDMLEVVFTPGTEVWYDHHGHKVGGVVTDICYDAGRQGEYFGMRVESLKSDGRSIVNSSKFKTIPKYLNVKSLSEFAVQRITPSMKQSLQNRGSTFRQYCFGQHHLEYCGMAFMDWPSREYAVQDELGRIEFGFKTFRADGRVMVDGESFVRFNASYEGRIPYWATRGYDVSRTIENCGIPDHELWRTWPTLAGFSFKAKRWGELAVDGLRPITYRSNAFDSLVMDAGRKDMVLALVEHANSCFKDIVDEKGGGCVFLLHGPPGVGKTLTAEATAEVVRRPLYSITVGELGSSVESMEDRLKYALELGRIWNAVLLIDECDIFLEKRDSNVTRNAMTGIFLRLLEYHQGILFLTSNRIKCFDPALNSRITVALHYSALDQSTRASVWRSMLTAAGMNASDFDVNALAADGSNGRQIKNAVRFAQVMAHKKQESIKQEHCLLASKLAREFHCDGDEF